MFRVVQRVWVARFYEQNAALLLLVFFVMFGLVETGQLWQYHVSLVYGTFDSFALMGLVALAWALYALRSLYFLAMALNQPWLSFLYDLNKLPATKRFVVIAYAQALTHLPVYLYAFFMMALAVYSANWGSLIFLASINLALLLASCYAINHLLTTVHVPVWSWPSLLPRWKKPVPYVWFYLGWIKHQHTLAWLLTKLFSGIAIVLFLQIETDQYDYRPAALGLCLSLTGHVVLVAELRKLEDRYLLFLRALPIAPILRFAQLLLVYTCLLLPELVLLAFSGVQFLDWVGLYLMGSSVLSFWHSNLYIPKWTMDQHIKRVVITYLIFFMTILSGFYWVAVIVVLANAIIVYGLHAHKHDVIEV